MASLHKTLLAAVLLCTFLTANAQCGLSCKFRTCLPNTLGLPKPAGGRNLLRSPGISLSGFVCLEDVNIGTVRKTGEALVEVNGTMIPISTYKPPKLSRPFRRSQFGLFPIPFLGGKQGIGRRESRGNQEKFLDNLCVVLPITKYNVIAEDDAVAERVMSDDEDSCVSFRTRTVEVLTDLTWNSSDDLDIKVITPSGTVLDKNNPLTPDARLTETEQENTCDGRTASKETAAIFNPMPAEKGTYTVEITHFKNCMDGPSDWELRFTVNGNLLAKRSGTSDLKNRGVIDVFQFSV